MPKFKERNSKASDGYLDRAQREGYDLKKKIGVVQGRVRTLWENTGIGPRTFHREVSVWIS